MSDNVVKFPTTSKTPAAIIEEILASLPEMKGIVILTLAQDDTAASYWSTMKLSDLTFLEYSLRRAVDKAGAELGEEK